MSMPLPFHALEKLRRVVASDAPTDSPPIPGCDPVGYLAVMRHLLTPLQLEEALDEYAQGEGKDSIGAILVRRGLLDPATLAELQREAKTDPQVPSVTSRYALLDIVGEGATAIVYRAFDRRLRRPVAVKLLKTAPGMHATLSKRFAREASALARLSHPHVLTIFDFGEAEGRPFLVTELIEGHSLREILRDRSWPRDKLVRLMESVVDAVHYVHENGLVHRDLKPSNILVTVQGEPKVADFGMAYSDETGTRLSGTGVAVGTPLYMAPEQLGGLPQNMTPRVDVFALGLILYETVVGRPARTWNPALPLKQFFEQSPVSLRQINQSIPRDLETIVAKAIAREPSERYPAAQILAQDLRSFRENRPISIHPPGILYRLRKAAARKKALWGAIGLCVVLSGALATVLVTSRGIRTKGSALLAAEDPGARFRRLEEETLKPMRLQIQEVRLSSYSPKVDYAQQLRKGEEFVRQLLEIAADPRFAECAELWKLIGLGSFVVDDLSGATEALRKAETLAPEDEEVRCALGRFCLGQAWLRKLLTEQEKNDYSEHWTAQALTYLKRDGEWIGAAREIDRHLARAYCAFAAEERETARALCREGIDRFSGEVAGREEYYLMLGLMASTAKEIEDAFIAALVIRPHFVAARQQRATLRFSRGDWNGAISDYSRLIDYHPNWAVFYFNRGLAESPARLFKDAIADFDAALRLGLNDKDLFYSRGLAKLESGDLDGAIEDLNQALEIDSRSADSYYLRGEARRRRTDCVSAVLDLNRAIELQPNRADFHFARGLAWFDRDHFPEAIEDFTTVLTIDPRYPGAHFNRGNAWLQLRKDENAAQDYSEALKLEPRSADAYYGRGAAKCRLGDCSGAVADYTEALRLNPRLVPAYMNRGEIYRTLGEYAAAAMDFRAVIYLSPQFATAYSLRGYARQELRDFPGALEDFSRCRRLAREGSSLHVEATREIRRILRNVLPNPFR